MFCYETWTLTEVSFSDSKTASPPRTHSIGGCHLDDHLDCPAAQVASVAAHHHGAALPVPEVHGGQDALDVVLQVVLLPLEHGRLPPEPVGTGPLVVEGGSLDRHHRDGARLHRRRGRGSNKKKKQPEKVAC